VPSLRARGIGLAVVPLLLATLAACNGDAAGKASADQRPAQGKASAADPSGIPSAAGSGDGSPGGSSNPRAGATTGAQVALKAHAFPFAEAENGSSSGSDKSLKGGGFATSVPGSDAPDRKVDVGPQYAVSKDLDIREVERLVRAVERIAKRQRVQSPLATGGSVADAVGTFSYRWFADGTVQPDPRWVASYIRTETVPILGSVTGNRVMLPQLRGALDEVIARGLADQIHPSEYGGCYVPRFIAHDPSKGLSLHTWGIAVDLNVPGNQRGTTGEMNRDVVAIFKKWGFAWGGDWHYTDPMHFELARIVRPR
jgi:hypothetical protein